LHLSVEDGQAELTWVAGYIQRWFTHLPMVICLSSIWIWHWLTSLMRPLSLHT